MQIWDAGARVTTDTSAKPKRSSAPCTVTLNLLGHVFGNLFHREKKYITLSALMRNVM
jgi:hypothetical protein